MIIAMTIAISMSNNDNDSNSNSNSNSAGLSYEACDRMPWHTPKITKVCKIVS